MQLEPSESGALGKGLVEQLEFILILADIATNGTAILSLDHTKRIAALPHKSDYIRTEGINPPHILIVIAWIT